MTSGARTYMSTAHRVFDMQSGPMKFQRFAAKNDAFKIDMSDSHYPGHGQFPLN